MSRERRRYFRIEDMVGIKAEAIDRKKSEQKLQQFWQDKHAFSIRNDFNYKLDQHLADLKSISQQMPELGRYLAVLQEQIDLLTAKILGEVDDFIDEVTDVCISAAGISYITNVQFKPGDIVQLHLKLLPEQQRIVIFSRVISCHEVPTQKGHYEIALDFEHVHESDRELLIKHVHKKQLHDLNNSRMEQQNNDQ